MFVKGFIFYWCWRNENRRSNELENIAPIKSKRRAVLDKKKATTKEIRGASDDNAQTAINSANRG